MARHLGVHKGHSGFRIPPPLKLHFCAPEALECDIPRMATPSGLSGCPGHAKQSFVQRGFPRALAHPGHSRPPGREFTTLTSSWLPPPCSFASLWHPPASSLGINLGLEKLDPFGLVWFYTRIFYTLRDASGKRHKLVLLLIIPVSFSPHPEQELIPPQGLLQNLPGRFQQSSGALWEQDNSQQCCSIPCRTRAELPSPSASLAATSRG